MGRISPDYYVQDGVIPRTALPVVLRRIARRMQVTRCETLDGYLVHLRDNAEEVQALLADLLISVTSFIFYLTNIAGSRINRRRSLVY